MAVIPKVQGDVLDTVTVTLSGVEDLTGAVVEAHVLRNGYETVTLAAAVLSAIARTVRVQLGGASGWLATAEPGLWKLEEQLTWPDTTVLTWPSEFDADSDYIKVRLDG